MYSVNPFFWICLGIVPFVCIGNTLVLVAIWKNPQIFHNGGINIIFTVTLAVADLATALVTFPLKSMSHFIESDINKHHTLCLIGCEMLSFTAITSGLSLGCIALEKYIRVSHPYWETEITTKRCFIIVGVVLFMAGGLSFSPAMGWNMFTQDMRESFRCSKAIILPLPYAFLIVAWILVLVLITTFCYSQIFITASRHQKILARENSRFGKESSPETNESSPETNEVNSLTMKLGANKKSCRVHQNCSKKDCHLKIVKTGIMHLGPYFLTWIPSMTLTAVMPFKKDSEDLWLYMTLHYCCFVLILVQACTNPVVYVLRMKVFRRAFKNVFTRHDLNSSKKRGLPVGVFSFNKSTHA